MGSLWAHTGAIGCIGLMIKRRSKEKLDGLKKICKPLRKPCRSRCSKEKRKTDAQRKKKPCLML